MFQQKYINIMNCSFTAVVICDILTLDFVYLLVANSKYTEELNYKRASTTSLSFCGEAPANLSTTSPSLMNTKVGIPCTS